MHFLDKLIPEKGSYRHPDGNAHAHIKASLLGSSKHFLVKGGRLVLGTWQAIFLCELGGPRPRQVMIKVMEGEAMRSHDILIVGAGLAGMRAAIAVAPDLDVAILSKVHPVRSHSVAAQGGVN